MLAKSARAEIVDVISEERKRPGSATYFGSGKVEELKELVTEKGITIVMVDAKLSPVQPRHLEAILDVTVLYAPTGATPRLRPAPLLPCLREEREESTVIDHVSRGFQSSPAPGRG